MKVHTKEAGEEQRNPTVAGAAGGGNRDTRINVPLATGRTVGALKEATDQMRLSTSAFLDNQNARRVDDKKPGNDPVGCTPAGISEEGAVR